jgi:preprotein translocase subunit SecE
MATTTEFNGPAAPIESVSDGFGLRSVIQELRRVVWPTRAELFRYTMVVIVTVVVVATFIAVVDALLQLVFKAVYGTG